MSRPKRIINMRVLPGEPLDGTGRVCIHLFVQDPTGPFVQNHVLHQAVDDQGQPIKGQLVSRPTRGRLACNPKRQAAPVTNNGVTTITPLTDDPRAVSCLKCKSSKDYTESVERIAALEAAR